MVDLAQAVVDVLAWFIMPFACVVAVSWAVSFFKR